MNDSIAAETPVLGATGSTAEWRGRCRQRIVTVSAIVALVVAIPGLAARYELKEGAQYALCRDYVAALNAAKREFPMACERHFPPEFEKFSKPKWTSLDPEVQPMELYKQMRFIWRERRASEEDWKLFKKNFLDPALEAGRVQLAQARVDIDATGDKETLLRFSHEPCEESLEAFTKGSIALSGGGYRYFVRDEETGDLLKSYDRIARFAPYGLFYFDGRAFLDSFNGFSIERLNKPWRKPGQPSGHLFVLEPGGNGAVGLIDVCTVKVYYELPGSEFENAGGNEQ